MQIPIGRQPSTPTALLSDAPCATHVATQVRQRSVITFSCTCDDSRGRPQAAVYTFESGNSMCHTPHPTASRCTRRNASRHQLLTRSRRKRVSVSCNGLPLLDTLFPAMDQLFALDCLSTGLTMDPSTGLPVGTSILQVKSGGLSCGGSSTVTPQGMMLAVSLVVLHLGLFMGPLLATFWLKGLSREHPQQTAVQAPAWVQASMVVFSVGTLGEIGAHMHDKWCAS